MSNPMILNLLQTQLTLLQLKHAAAPTLLNDDDGKKRWITTETGSHVQLDGDGTVLAGMGGKFTGLNCPMLRGKAITLVMAVWRTLSEKRTRKPLNTISR
jgi:hypothetical protein